MVELNSEDTTLDAAGERALKARAEEIAEELETAGPDRRVELRSELKVIQRHIGPFLDGAVKVIEGRGYEADGKVTFNALAVISYNPAKRVYTMRSYALGDVGDFVLTPTADGFTAIPHVSSAARYAAQPSITRRG